MSYLTVGDLYNLISSEIRTRFADVNLEFEVKTFHNRSELWVYVLNTRKTQEISSFCRQLERRPMEPQVPLHILVKTWTGPWPGGESEQTIRERRRQAIHNP